MQGTEFERACWGLLHALMPPGLHAHVPGILPLGQNTSGQMGGRARVIVAGAAETDVTKRTTDASESEMMVRILMQLLKRLSATRRLIYYGGRQLIVSASRALPSTSRRLSSNTLQHHESQGTAMF